MIGPQPFRFKKGKNNKRRKTLPTLLTHKKETYPPSSPIQYH